MGIKTKNMNERYYPIEKILKKRIVKGKVNRYLFEPIHPTNPYFRMQKVQYLIKWLNYSKKSNSWQPAENIKLIKPKMQHETPQKQPVKILSRFERNWCLVKWANGRTSTIQLSPRETYEIVVNGMPSQ